MTDPEHVLVPYREDDEFGFVPCWCVECEQTFLNSDLHAEAVGV